MRDVRRANTGLRIKNVGMSHEDEQNRSTEMSVNDGDEIARLPRCGSAACDQPALFGYRSYGDALTWERASGFVQNIVHDATAMMRQAQKVSPRVAPPQC
jgi:hypothetical protein